jgi:hypothetical protein
MIDVHDRPGLSVWISRTAATRTLYHYYDAFDSGDAWVQVRPIAWTRDGWPVTGQALVPLPGSPSGAAG